MREDVSRDRRPDVLENILPGWTVVLLNDDYNTMPYVVTCLLNTVRARPSLLPTILWAIGALVFLALLIGLLAVTLPTGFPPRSARAFIGALILLVVLTLALGLKALESYLKWKEAR